MNLKKYNKLLHEYKSELNNISENDVEYEVIIGATVSSFFNKVSKLDKNFLEKYFYSFDKERLRKNKVQEDTFAYLFLLTIKNSGQSEILSKFFPSFLEQRQGPFDKSNWLIIRWWQAFISWLFKPQLKEFCCQEGICLLNKIRDIKARIEKTEDHLLGINVGDALCEDLSFVIKKFFEEKPCCEDYFFLDMNSLLSVLENRINLLTDLKLKQHFHLLLSNQEFFDQESLKQKIFKIEKILCKNKKNNSSELESIDNIIIAIKQRLSLKRFYNYEKFNNEPIIYIRPNFKNFLKNTIEEMQFCYEVYRENLEKNNENLKILSYFNRLEKILYDAALVVHIYGIAETQDMKDIRETLQMRKIFSPSETLPATDLEFCHAACNDLHASLSIIQEIVAQLDNYVLNNINSGILATNMRQFSKFILNKISELRCALTKEIQKNIDRENDDWGEDWSENENVSKMDLKESDRAVLDKVNLSYNVKENPILFRQVKEEESLEKQQPRDSRHSYHG